ncbi:MAG: hypothetical protein ABJC39_03860 [Chloroflexota bacterium]
MTLWIATVATARPATIPAIPAPADFHPVAIGPVPSTTPAGDVALPPLSSAAPIVDFSTRSRSFAPRPTPKQPSVARVQPKALAQFRAGSTGKHATGTATWYCKTGVSVCTSGYPGGMYAAAGPALRVGAWRGRVVHVCGGGRCVNVKLIDWCACGGSHIIDLYSDAFRQLAPGAGGLRVTVRW